MTLLKHIGLIKSEDHNNDDLKKTKEREIKKEKNMTQKTYHIDGSGIHDMRLCVSELYMPQQFAALGLSLHIQGCFSLSFCTALTSMYITSQRCPSIS